MSLIFFKKSNLWIFFAIQRTVKIFFSKVVVCICNLTNLQSANYKHFLLQKM